MPSSHPLALSSPHPDVKWVDHLPEPALLVDAARDVIIAVNSSFARMLGTKRGNLTGTSCTRLFDGQRPLLIAFTEETLFRGGAWSRD